MYFLACLIYVFLDINQVVSRTGNTVSYFPPLFPIACRSFSFSSMTFSLSFPPIQSAFVPRSNTHTHISLSKTLSFPISCFFHVLSLSCFFQVLSLSQSKSTPNHTHNQRQETTRHTQIPWQIRPLQLARRTSCTLPNQRSRQRHGSHRTQSITQQERQ